MDFAIRIAVCCSFDNKCKGSRAESNRPDNKRNGRRNGQRGTAVRINHDRLEATALCKSILADKICSHNLNDFTAVF